MSAKKQSIVIRGATVVNPDSMFVADVRIADGVIEAVGDSLTGDIVLDAVGCFVSSGFVDLHTHLREPGKEEAETIESGSRAAVLGGFTAVVAMPNTDPAQDNVATVQFVRDRGRAVGLCEVIPSGCITVGRLGAQLVPFEQLANEGVTLFTDDGTGVQDALVMQRALMAAKRLNLTISQHCEVASMTVGAVMHDGACCSTMGVPGWPSAAEEEMVRRDIQLVRMTGAREHFMHLSTKGSVELVRAAKAEGLAVTAEVTPHHISLTDELLSGFDPIFKVNPPLRTMADITALHEGLADGTIDAIATDHAPHAGHTKEQTLDTAPPGMLGLETALGVVNTAVKLSPQKIASLMSWNPSVIANISDHQGRPIAVGEPAHIAVWDTTTVWSVSRDELASRSTNTPYHGMELRGRVRHTIYNGQLVVQEGEGTRVSTDITNIALVLEDGSVFEGEAVGYMPENGIAAGEVVFHTALTGYQEVFTDPSYAGQIITFTTSHIGNYGVTPIDSESRGTFARGVIMRDMARRHSNWRSESSLDEMLKAQKLPGVAGLDTRRLTRLLRDSGSLRGAFGTADQSALLAAAKNEKGTSGIDLVSEVTTPQPYTVGSGKFNVVAYDFGIKTTILRHLSEIATVTVVPASMTAEEVLSLSPSGVFLSNGPGDPEMVKGATEAIRSIVEAGTPAFGICLGHQLLSRAFGGQTFKLPFGHHGANHPVRHIATGTVEITSQNHNFCVDPDSLSGVADITHVNLNDHTNEGMRLRDLRAFSVQYHPEAGPGPHDSQYLFGQFAELMEKK